MQADQCSRLGFGNVLGFLSVHATLEAVFQFLIPFSNLAHSLFVLLFHNFFSFTEEKCGSFFSPPGRNEQEDSRQSWRPKGEVSTNCLCRAFTPLEKGS